MKFASRAVLAVLLLIGFYTLALLIIVLLWTGVIELIAHDVPGALDWTFVLFTIVVSVTVVRAVLTRSSSGSPSGLVMPEWEEPRLWTEMRALAQAIGTRCPDEIRLVPDPNAAVADDSRWLGLLAGKRRVYIGAPLLLALTTDQIRWVLAHELGHYSGRHTSLGGLTYRGTESIGRIIDRLGSDSLIGSVFVRYGRLYLRVSRRVNRRQELEADRAAAQLVGSTTATTTLRALTPTGLWWTEYVESHVGAAARIGRRPTAVLDGFALSLADESCRAHRSAIADAMEGSEGPMSPYGSHPSDAVRIAALGDAPSPHRPDGENPAWTLLQDPHRAFAALEEEWLGGSGLTPTPVVELAPLLGEAVLTDRARVLQGALAAQGLTADLAGCLSAWRDQRLEAVVASLDPSADRDEILESRAGLVGDLMAWTMVRSGDATHRPDWLRVAVLVDSVGERLDPWAVVSDALDSPDGATEMTRWLEGRGVPLDLAPPPSRPAAELPHERWQIRGVIAPLVGGRKFNILVVHDGGVVLRGTRFLEGVRISPLGQTGRLDAAYTRFFRGRSVESLEQDKVSWPLRWADVASLHIQPAKRKQTEITVTSTAGRVVNCRAVAQTAVIGTPIPVLAAHLGDRLTHEDGHEHDRDPRVEAHPPRLHVPLD